MTTDLTARSARDAALGVRETRTIAFEGVELREQPDGTGGSVLNFEGYACMTERSYEMQDMFGPYTEVVRRGAFGKTLSEGADVAFLVNHEGMTLARTKSGTLQLAEDETGLHTAAQLDSANPTVQSVRSAMDRKDMDEMSFAFVVRRQAWSPDYDQRDILEVDISKGDVSLVNYGANPYTSAALRARAAGIDIPARALAAALVELRAGATLSTASVATLKHVLSLASTADDAVDELQEVLSTFLGVPNPDDDDAQNSGSGDEPPAGEAKASTLGLYVARARALALNAR